MAKKKSPPPLSSVTWSIREVLDPGTPVASVACANGGIMVGGTHLYRIAPGGWGVQYRGLPEGAELPLSIAVEPRTPFRIAVGPETGDVIIFTDTTTANSIIGHTFNEARGSKQAAELAWVVNEGQSSLFARTDDRQLYRMQTEGWDTLDMPPVHAIASDETGAFAALTVVDGEPRVYITADGGEHFHHRRLGVDVEAAPDAPAFLALAGMAVVFGVGDSGPLVSRGLDVPTARYTGLDRAYAAAFQGPDPEGWIYVAVQRLGDVPAEVWLLDAAGSKIKVMDFRADDNAPLDLGPIAWDAARRALMISSRGGLLAMGPETPRPKKRPPAPKKPLPQ